MRVADMLGVRTVSGIKYGIEVEMEVENTLFPPVIAGSWRYERDGSLDEATGAEYVLRNPMTYNASMIAINSLYEFLGERREHVVDTVRPGIHVHVNVQDLEVVQLFNLICINYILEGLMSRWCGDTRKDNMFCLKSSNAETVRFVVRSAVEAKNLRVFATDAIRYSAMNLKALTNYGSVEFRSLNFSMDKDRLVFWLGLIKAMRIVAKQFKDPQKIVERFNHLGPSGFLNHVLSKHPTHKSTGMDMLWTDTSEEEMLEGVEAVEDLAFCVEDWDTHFAERKQQAPEWEERWDEVVNRRRPVPQINIPPPVRF